VNGYQLSQEFVIPWTRGTGCSVSLLMNPKEPLEAEVMVSHAWAESMDEVCKAMHRELTKKTLTVHTKIWFCIFANYQPEDTEGCKLIDQLHRKPFESVITSELCNRVIVLQTTTAKVYERLWCTFELGVAVDCGKIVIPVLSDAAYKQNNFSAKLQAILIQLFAIAINVPIDICFDYYKVWPQDNVALEYICGAAVYLVSLLSSWWIWQRFFINIFKNTLRVNTEQAAASDPQDRIKLRQWIQERGGFAKFDQIVFELRLRYLKEEIATSEYVGEYVVLQRVLYHTAFIGVWLLGLQVLCVMFWIRILIDLLPQCLLLLTFYPGRPPFWGWKYIWEKIKHCWKEYYWRGNDEE